MNNHKQIGYNEAKGTMCFSLHPQCMIAEKIIILNIYEQTDFCVKINHKILLCVRWGGAFTHTRGMQY